MRPMDLVDVSLLLVFGLVLDAVFPEMSGLAPAFLLAAFAVIVWMKRDWRLIAASGGVLVIFTLLDSGFTGTFCAWIFLSAALFIVLAERVQRSKMDQGFLLWVMTVAVTFIVGWLVVVISGQKWDAMLWHLIFIRGLLTSLVAYAFVVTLEYAERIFSIQFRKVN